MTTLDDLKEAYGDLYHVVAYGIYLGYPQCCIEEFIEYWQAIDIADTETRNALIEDRLSRGTLGTGYIPCNTCKDRPLAEVIEGINKRRMAPLKFPKCDLDTMRSDIQGGILDNCVIKEG